MRLGQSHDAEGWVRAVRWTENILLLLLFLQLFRLYLIPAYSNTLDPAWWSWLHAAVPLALVGALGRLKSGRSAPRLRGESAETIRWERPRRYGRTH